MKNRAYITKEHNEALAALIDFLDTNIGRYLLKYHHVDSDVKHANDLAMPELQFVFNLRLLEKKLGVSNHAED